MEPLMTVLVSILSSGAVAALVTFLTNTFIGERIKNAIKNEYDLKLEEHKAKLAVASSDQAKRRQLYDDLSGFIEGTFGSGEIRTKDELSLAANSLFAKLALYAPDEVYLAVKIAIVDKGIVVGKDVKPTIYCALRKSLFGKETKMECGDFVPHIEAEHIPKEQLKAS